MANGLKFRIQKVEGLLYKLCSENKDADQLCSNRAADLHLGFHIWKKQVLLQFVFEPNYAKQNCMCIFCFILPLTVVG